MSERSWTQCYAEILSSLPAEGDGLKDTPKRAAKALEELTSGYREDPCKHLQVTFPAEGYDEVVALRGVKFVSLCEHHMLPFVGTAALAYLPGDRIVGLSKLARVVTGYAKRLQVQERLTRQVVEGLVDTLAPRGAAVVIRAHHSCMGIRGACQPGAEMATVALRGVFRDDAAARAEVMGLLL
jgi:GTP cyclohydrolase I